MTRDYEQLKNEYTKLKTEHGSLREQFHEVTNQAELAMQAKQAIESECGAFGASVLF
jgi:hypothetical protein